MSGHLDRFVQDVRAAGRVAVQPRMGFGDPARQRRGLLEVSRVGAPVVGTITVDSYTRVGDHVTPLERLAAGEELNGYPLVSHPAEVTRRLLEGVHGPAFPVQVRHGTSQPRHIVRRLIEVGLDATEGGPVSYCLPYSRLPLAEAVRAWGESCRLLAGETEAGHVESFGGCLMGQLCPPSLLVAVTVLEGCFFRRHGVRHLSLSYAQGTHPEQDRGAVRALRRLARRHLADVEWHVVLYTFMGVFPNSRDGARRLLRDSARIARDTGCGRLVVKTVAEAREIPTIEQNTAALHLAAAAAEGSPRPPTALEESFAAEIAQEAEILVEAVLDLDPDLGRALVKAFERGVLDIPFCVHPDNRAAATCVIDGTGAMVWGSVGGLPLPRSAGVRSPEPLTADRLDRMLHHVQRRYDRPDPTDDAAVPDAAVPDLTAKGRS